MKVLGDSANCEFTDVNDYAYNRPDTLTAIKAVISRALESEHERAVL